MPRGLDLPCDEQLEESLALAFQTMFACVCKFERKNRHGFVRIYRCHCDHADFFAQVCRMETIRWALTTCLQLLKATLLQKMNPWRSGIGR